MLTAAFLWTISAAAGENRVSKHTEYRDCSSPQGCPVMVYLPAGSFVMGSPRNEPGRFDDEDQRVVKVHAFSVAKFATTRGEWKIYAKQANQPAKEAPCAYAQTQHPTWADPGFAQEDTHPVVCISWGDAVAYARWLSAKTGHSYRLLTDPEREYAARAGTTTAFPWGSAASHQFANYGLDECCGPAKALRDKWMFTSPVGSFPPNRFRLYDMHGNVFEWTSTCADPFEKLQRKAGPAGCAHRYARGGVYADRPALMRSAAKNYAPPEDDAMNIETYRSAGFGFRVARDD